jgi:hypothetical protein
MKTLKTPVSSKKIGTLVPVATFGRVPILIRMVKLSFLSIEALYVLPVLSLKRSEPVWH